MRSWSTTTTIPVNALRSYNHTANENRHTPNKFYNVGGLEAVKHVFAGNDLIPTVASSSAPNTIALTATSTDISTGFTSGPSTKNIAHTTSGSNRLLVLTADIWQDSPGVGTITSATYNGTALTKATSTRSGGMASEIWYLANPQLGSNTLSVTITGATDAIKLAGASFSGILQSFPLLDAIASRESFGGNPSATTTTATANALVVATLSRFGTTDATTNRTSIFNDSVTSTLGAASYQIATAAGAYGDQYVGSASADWSMAMAGFEPATSNGKITYTVPHRSPWRDECHYGSGWAS